MPLLVLVALLAAAPSPVVVVPAFQVPDGPTGAKSNIGLALASVAETDLAQARIHVRSEDDLDVKNVGKVAGASHLLSGKVISMAGTSQVTLNLTKVSDGLVVAASKVRFSKELSGDARREVVRLVCEGLGQPQPKDLVFAPLSAELLEAWGQALALVGSGDPARAREAVEAVAKRWPDFEPAARRLKMLGGK
jgi:hypothetical protein